MTHFYRVIARRSLTTFNYDDLLHLEVKTGMSQPEHYTIPGPAKYVSYKAAAEKAAAKHAQHGGDADGEEARERRRRVGRFVRATAYLSKFVQLNTPGFLPNIRQHRQFGLAVLHMAQALREHTLARHRGLAGTAVPDVVSSQAKYVGWKPFPGKKGQHVFGWRDYFDIAVRWRQYCEPMDVVYWLDRLDLPDDQSSRVGLNTYMIAGSKKITRYHLYNDWAFNITKKNMAEVGVMNAKEEFFVLPPHHKQMARDARTHEDLFVAAGRIPFVQVGRVGFCPFSFVFWALSSPLSSRI